MGLTRLSTNSLKEMLDMQTITVKWGEGGEKGREGEEEKEVLKETEWEIMEKI